MNDHQTTRTLPIFIVRFANLTLLSGVIGSWLILAYGIKHFTLTRPTDTRLMWGFAATLLIASGLFGMALRLEKHAKVKLVLVLASTTLSIYLAELGLTIIPPSSDRLVTEIDSNNDDPRDKFTVLTEIRETGSKAYPSLIPDQYLPAFDVDHQELFPLGGISNSTTVYCNENGYWSIYKSDEHGFNNPSGLYTTDGIDIAIIGDSFAEGACVEPNETIAAVLRQQGYRTLSFGKGGNGPLVELASLAEYARPIEPEIVLWLYCETNDLTWLETEEQWDFLTPYLMVEQYSQNLVLRQSEIDNLLIQYAKRQEQLSKTTRPNQFQVAQQPTSTFLHYVQLDQLRARLNLRLPTPIVPVPRSFREVFTKAKDMVTQWGGVLYFVYLPTGQRYQEPEARLPRDPKSRAEVLRIVSELNIPLIDIHEELFLTQSNPTAFFSRGLSHFNAAGYRKVAETLGGRIRLDDRQLP